MKRIQLPDSDTVVHDVVILRQKRAAEIQQELVEYQRQMDGFFTNSGPNASPDELVANLSRCNQRMLQRAEHLRQELSQYQHDVDSLHANTSPSKASQEQEVHKFIKRIDDMQKAAAEHTAEDSLQAGHWQSSLTLETTGLTDEYPRASSYQSVAPPSPSHSSPQDSPWTSPQEEIRGVLMATLGRLDDTGQPSSTSSISGIIKHIAEALESDVPLSHANTHQPHRPKNFTVFG